MRKKLILKLFLEHKVIYSFILAVGVLVAVLETLHVAIVFPLFNSLMNVQGGAAYSNPLTDALTSFLGWLTIKDQVVTACVVSLALIFVKGALGIYNEYQMGLAGSRVLENTRRQLIHKYAGLSYAAILDAKHGEMMYYALTSPFQLADLFRKLPLAATELLKMLFLCAFLLSVSVKITVAVIFLGALFSWIISRLSKTMATRIGRERAGAYAVLSVVFSEFISGIKQIRVYGAEKRWISEFDEANKKYADLHVKESVLLSLPKNLLEIIGFAFLFAIILLVQFFKPGSVLTLFPIMGLFGMGILRLLPTASNFSRTWLQIASCLPEAGKINEILSRKDDAPAFGRTPFTGLTSDIKFDNVSFAYKTRTSLFSDVNVSFEKNKVTALVGDSGSGKTTLINLLLGLFEPTTGQIIVNGLNLQNYDVRTWLNHIGFVSQDSFIFHSTIRENITLGHPGYTDEDVMEAAKVTNAHDFIMDLPMKYDTLVGEKGMKLSGGQQQRLAIARAILRKPEILIFDEATSALDNISEKLVQSAIQRISQNHTVIMIAHRLSTITNAHKIVFLENGRFVEQGTHTELMEKKGAYYRLTQAVV